MSDEILFLRLSEVKKRSGLSKAQIYKLIRKGDFPAPIKEGRNSLWPDVRIEAWQKLKMAA